MSLYRTYRPQTLEDVAGQDHVVSTLKQATEQGKLSHAYLFAGTRGTGKTSVARILAKILLTHGITDPVLKEQIVKAVEEGNIVDLVEIDAASNTGVDNIRDLIEKIQFSPVVGAAKVYIIDEAHMLSKGAFNALLKTLEEPPPYAYFILATTELHKIPVTIQSRCQRFLFRQIDEKDIIARLKFIAGKENITIDDGALSAIAHHVAGGMRDAVSLLDQLRALETITVQDVKERIGETGHEFVEQTLDAISKNDRGEILSIVHELENTGVPLENFVRLLLQAVRNNLHTNVQENADITMQKQALTTLLQTASDLRIAPVGGLVLEAALLSLCTGQTSNQPKPKAVENAPAAPTVSAPPVPAPTPASAPIAASAPAPTPPPVTPTVPEPSVTAPAAQSALAAPALEDIQRDWQEIIQGAAPAFVKMSLKNSHPHALDGDLLTLSFASGFHRDKVAQPAHIRTVEELLIKRYGRHLKLTFALGSELGGPRPGASQMAVDLASAAMDVF